LTEAAVMIRQVRTARSAAGGFTLVEAMVVVAMLTVLGLLASSSMRPFIDRNRLAAATGRFVSDLHLARSEAIRQGRPVALCPSADGVSCLEGDSWRQGWIVFSDPEATGSPATPEAVLRRHKALGPGDRFDATPGTGPLIFGREGFLLRLPVSTAVVRAQALSGPVRCVSINRAGHQAVHDAGREDCA
jgi:type IV fimbrial biogenesis protein FimT